MVVESAVDQAPTLVRLHYPRWSLSLLYRQWPG